MTGAFLFRVKNTHYNERIKCALERSIQRVSQKTGTEMEIRLNRFATGGMPRKRNHCTMTWDRVNSSILFSFSREKHNV